MDAIPVLQPLDGERFPPVLTPQQAARLLQVSIASIYRWSSEERMKGFASRGRPLRILRDPLVHWWFEHRATLRPSRRTTRSARRTRPGRARPSQ